MKVGFLLVCAAVLLAPVLVGARHIALNERVPEKRQFGESLLIPLLVDLFADLGTSAVGGALSTELGSAVVGAGVGAVAAGTAHQILTHVGAQAVQKQPEPSTTEVEFPTFPTTTPQPCGDYEQGNCKQPCGLQETQIVPTHNTCPQYYICCV